MIYCRNSISSRRSVMYSIFSFTLVTISTSSLSDPIFSSIIFCSSMSLCIV